jgi:hypothetical protein
VPVDVNNGAFYGGLARSALRTRSAGHLKIHRRSSSLFEPCRNARRKTRPPVAHHHHASIQTPHRKKALHSRARYRWAHTRNPDAKLTRPVSSQHFTHQNNRRRQRAQKSLTAHLDPPNTYVAHPATTKPPQSVTDWGGFMCATPGKKSLTNSNLKIREPPLPLDWLHAAKVWSRPAEWCDFSSPCRSVVSA